MYGLSTHFGVKNVKKVVPTIIVNFIAIFKLLAHSAPTSRRIAHRFYCTATGVYCQGEVVYLIVVNRPPSPATEASSWEKWVALVCVLKAHTPRPKRRASLTTLGGASAARYCMSSNDSVTAVTAAGHAGRGEM